MQFGNVWLVFRHHEVDDSDELLFVSPTEEGADKWIRDAHPDLKSQVYRVEVRSALIEDGKIALLDVLELGVQWRGRRFDQPIISTTPPVRKKRAR
jgi:hypothetical protein